MGKHTRASIPILLILCMVHSQLSAGSIADKLTRLSDIMSEINQEVDLHAAERLSWGNQYDKLFNLATEYPVKFSKTLFLVHSGMYVITNYNLYNILWEQMGLFTKYKIPSDSSL